MNWRRAVREAPPGSHAPLPEDGMRFSYHRSVAPMMWAFVGLMTIELLVVHVLVGLWWPVAAMILSAVSLLGLVWLVRAIRSFRDYPVEIGEDVLVWRVGTLRSLTVPLAAVADARAGWDGAALKSRDILNLALLAYPNVLLDLKRPITGRRGRVFNALAHKLDDPASFLAALERRRAADDMPET